MNADGWHRVDPTDVPDDGPVRTAVIDGRSVALSRCGRELGALENRCPHQGGPLGEGSIENGWLRCPWHGYDYDPISGSPPPGFGDAVGSYPVEDGVAAAAVFEALSRHLPADAVVTVDVGNHAYSLGRYLESRDQPVLMSGYLGSIGFGYPAALGAWAAAAVCRAGRRPAVAIRPPEHLRSTSERRKP